MAAAARTRPAGPIAAASIEQAIIVVRGRKVMTDQDLAALYGVPTKRLNEQARRNAERFPEDFMFRLAPDEWAALRSQVATLKAGRGQHRKYPPYAFTEHGALMAANVLNSPRAVEASVYVVRAFVRLRDMVTSNKALAAKLEELEKRLDTHDQAIARLIDTMRQLMKPQDPPGKRKIGFV